MRVCAFWVMTVLIINGLIDEWIHPTKKQQMGHKLCCNTIILDYSTASRQSGRIIAALFAICSRPKMRKLSALPLPTCPLFIPLLLRRRSRFREGLPDRHNLVNTRRLFCTDWDTLWRMITFIIVTCELITRYLLDLSVLPLPIQSNILALDCGALPKSRRKAFSSFLSAC